MPRKIGIVDDSVTIRTAFQLTFAGEDLGMEGHVFASVDEALKATDKYDLLYVDTKLGADDGYSACAKLRGSPAFAAAPVVMIFGPWETYDEARGKGSGAVGGIQKPWDADDIIARTQAYLSGAPQPAVAAVPARAAAPAPAPAPAAAAPAAPPARPVPAGAPIPPAPPPGQRIPTQIQLPGGRPAPGMPGGIPGSSGLTKPLQPVPTPAQAKPAPAGVPPSPPAQAARTPLAEFAQAAAPARAPAQAPAAAHPATHAAVSAAATAGLAEKLADEVPGLSHDQIQAIVKIVARDVVEQVAWEVVPDLAETIIREQIQALLKE